MKNNFTPVFRFVMCSDSHIEGIGTPGYERLKKTIDYSLAFAEDDEKYKGIDRFFIAGDITNKGSKEEFDAFISKCKELSFYDTGITPQYGDKTICLSTCEYTLDNGRLVLAAVRIS